MTDTGIQAAWRRYSRADCRIDPEAKLLLQPFSQALHAALTWWVAQGVHVRDFVEGVRHCANLTFGEHAFAHHPRFALPQPDYEGLTVLAPFKGFENRKHRLYDELDALAPEVDTNRIQAVVNVGFLNWVAHGWHPRDFVEAAADTAVVLVYDLQVCQSLGGLGGCRSGKDFMTEPYRG